MIPMIQVNGTDETAFLKKLRARVLRQRRGDGFCNGDRPQCA